MPIQVYKTAIDAAKALYPLGGKKLLYPTAEERAVIIQEAIDTETARLREALQGARENQEAEEAPA